MTERKPLTERELAAIATALKLAPSDFCLGPNRVEDRAVCDGLVERGSLVAVDVEEGSGYRLSDELSAAISQRASRN